MLLTKDLIDPSVFPLKPVDSVAFAKEMLHDFRVWSLPVVENDQLIGFFQGSDAPDLTDDQPIREFIQPKPGQVLNVHVHFHEVIKRFSDLNNDCLAVVDDGGEFAGIITSQTIFRYLSGTYTYQAEGGVICVEMASRNYSLHEISRIIESDDAKIIGVLLFHVPDRSKILVSLKINTHYIDRIMATLQRFGYEINASFNHTHSESDYENRYHSLLKYLEF